MLKFSIKLNGGELIGTGKMAYRDIKLNSRDFKPAFEKIGDDFLKIEAEQFSTEGARGGIKWKHLSPRTLDIKHHLMMTRQAVSLKPLIRTGRLYASLTHKGASGQIRDIQPLQARFGTSIPYGIKHHLGIGVAQRQVVRLKPNDVKRWTKILYNHMMKNVKK